MTFPLSAPFEPGLFLGKSISFVQHLQSSHSSTASLEELQIDVEVLPKVDVRKQQTILSDCWVSYRETYNLDDYVFACTDT